MGRFGFGVLVVVLCACAGCVRQIGPVLYDNILFETEVDKMITGQQMPDEAFKKTLSSRLYEFAGIETGIQGDMRLAATCVPRTIKILQDVTDITSNTTTYTDGSGFFVLELLNRSESSQDYTDFRVNTITTIINCENDTIVAKYDLQGYGDNLINAIRNAASQAVSYGYWHRRTIKQ